MIRGWWLFSYLLLWLLVVGVSLVALATLRQLGLVFVRLGGSLGARQTSSGPSIGDQAPVSRVHDRDGIVRSLIPGKESIKLLLFMSPTCDVCDALIPLVPGYARSIHRGAELLVILSGPDQKGKLAKWREGRPPVVVDPSIGDLFDLPAMPYGVAIDQDGKVASKGTVNDLVQLESLLNDADRLRQSQQELSPTSGG